MRRHLGGALVVALATGCGGSGSEDGSGSPTPEPPGTSTPANTPPVPWEVTPFPEVPVPADNPITPEKTLLGRLLFYDPVLSSDQEVACVTCHSELWGMSDGLPVSVGVQGDGPIGTGRDGPHKTRRNSQTLWNVAFREDVFWDGRSDSLEDQVLFPLDTFEELGRDPNDVMVDLAAIAEYVDLFESAFPGESNPVTVENLQKAIATFERTLVTKRSAYDLYLRGDENALDDEAKEGMFLFGEAGCATCHVPPLFESELYFDRGVENPPVAPDDAGRFEVTGADADQRAFKVPTLRNLRETNPYFHSGAVEELEDAVAQEARLSEMPLDDSQIRALAAFIERGLTDESEKPDRPRSVPSGLQVPLDGFRIPR